jgi:hypothetical protein
MDKWIRWEPAPMPEPPRPEEIWWTREWFAAQLRALVELLSWWF